MRTKIIFFFALTLTIKAFTQTNYYVSPSGDNSNNGDSRSPFKTIQHGLDQLQPNDVLNIMSGMYNETIVIKTNNITLQNHNNDQPIIDGTGVTSSNQLAIIAVYNKTGITIRGLEIRNNNINFAQGIVIEGQGSNYTIENCKIHDINFSSNPNAPVNANTNAQGIVVYGTGSTTSIRNLKIINNEIYNCRLGYSEGLAVDGNVDGFEVSGNKVYDITNIGILAAGHYKISSNEANDQPRNGLIKNNIVYNCISPYASSGGIYIDGAKDIVIENNTSYHNGYGIEIGCEIIGKTASNITVRNNIIYDNQYAGIALGGFDFPNGSGSVINTTIRNNTVFSNDFIASGLGELYLSHSQNSIIENNIFHANTRNVIAYADKGQPSLSFDYNIFYTNAGSNQAEFGWNGAYYVDYNNFISGSSTNSSSKFSNPQFVNASITKPDFHLAPSSIAINSGNPSYIPTDSEVDMDGETRNQDIIDIGADEFGSTLSVDENQFDDFSIYPNPAKGYINLKSKTLITKIEVYSLLGQHVLTINNPKLKNKIHLSKGTYLLKVRKPRSYTSKKLIIN